MLCDKTNFNVQHGIIGLYRAEPRQTGKLAMSEFTIDKDQKPLERRVDELQAALLKAEPGRLAEFTGAALEGAGESASFTFQYWNKPVELSCQDYIARDRETQQVLPSVHQAMILYYFSTPRSCPLAAKWISFSELEEGQFYNAAFQGYTSKVLFRVFGEDYQAFHQANQQLGGEKTSFGDSAYRHQIFPKLALLVVLWEGDEDFPPSYKILFEDNIDNYLPTEGSAILASMLTGKLTEAV